VNLGAMNKIGRPPVKFTARLLVAGLGCDPAHRFLDGSGDDVDVDVLTRKIYEGADFGRDTKASSWYDARFSSGLAKHDLCTAPILLWRKYARPTPPSAVVTSPSTYPARAPRSI
jgi:hypothetical protein